MLAYEGLLDPGKNHNKSYSLTSLLVALTAAILCNHLSVLACAEWLADQSSTVKKALGFEDDGSRTLCQSTFQRAFKKLEAAALEKAVSDYFEGQSLEVDRGRGSQSVAIDGKVGF